MDDLAPLFRQVEISRWINDLGNATPPRTFRSCVVFATQDEAQLFLGAPAASDDALANVRRNALAAKLETEIQRFGSAAVVKLGDMSPKDSAVLEGRLEAMYRQFLPSIPGMVSNRKLQAYCKAKCYSQRVNTGLEAVEMLEQSDRCRFEAERHSMEAAALPIEQADADHFLPFTVREWSEEMDPALEFRCWVTLAATGTKLVPKVTGISQMASMDIALHYRQVFGLEDFLLRRITAFLEFDEVVSPAIVHVLQLGPEKVVVVDVAYSFTSDLLLVVEMNPFITSSGGHMYKYWDEADKNMLLGRTPAAKVELRLRKSTPSDTLDCSPRKWRDLLHEEGGSANSDLKAAPGSQIILACTGKPGDYPDGNLAQVVEESLTLLRLFAFHLVPVEKVTVLCLNFTHRTEVKELVEKIPHLKPICTIDVATPSSFSNALQAVARSKETSRVFLYVIGHGNTEHGPLEESLTSVPVPGTDSSVTGVVRKEGSDLWWLQFRCRHDGGRLVEDEPIKDENSPHYILTNHQLKELAAGVNSHDGTKIFNGFFGFCYSSGMAQVLFPATVVEQTPYPSGILCTTLPNSMGTTWGWTAFRGALSHRLHMYGPSRVPWPSIMRLMHSSLLCGPGDKDDAAQLVFVGLPDASNPAEDVCFWFSASIDDGSVPSPAQSPCTPQSPSTRVRFVQQSTNTVFEVDPTTFPAIARGTISIDDLRGRVESNTSEAARIREVLEFASNNDRRKWRTENWNAVLELAFSLLPECSDIVEALLEWRENQTHGGEGDAHELGNSSKALHVPWCPDGDPITFSFEVEGSSLTILDYYRPETIGEEEWLNMTMKQRWSSIGSNWAKLKVRLSTVTIPWMNANLTIEDGGFLWEVSYGGSSPGYSVDLDYVSDQIVAVEELGLSVGDREHDSGIQAHVVFPLFTALDSPDLRRRIVSLAVHVDDFLFFRDFRKLLGDDCNNPWASTDVKPLLDHAVSYAEFAHHVSTGKMPNLRTKHKHLGFRGKDCYRSDNKFGFEVRRGCGTAQLLQLLQQLAELIPKVGDDAACVKLNRARKSSTDATTGYSFASIVSHVDPASGNRFCLNERSLVQGNESADALAAIASTLGGAGDAHVFLSGCRLAAQPYADELISWQRYLLAAKNAMYSQGVSPPPTEEFVGIALAKSMQRLMLVVLSKWEGHPAVVARATQWKAETIAAERMGLIDDLLHLGSKSSEAPGGPIAEATRNKIVDFAFRLATLY